MKFLLWIMLSSITFATDWDTKYNQVCSVDDMCDRLKTSDGAWLKPKNEIVALLKDKDVQKQIQTVSKKYGVDPTAVAGSILAENSLNVGVKDSVQTWLASKAGITSIAGKSFSFGLGQIQLQAAQEADRYLAKLENRAPKSDDELIEKISDPMGSIEVAASIVRKVQDDYKAQGIDVSNKPGVLASLYNLGKSEERAAAAKKSGRVPQENYFGLFVEKYTPEIQAAAGISSATATTASTDTKSAAASKPQTKTVSSGLNRKYTVTSAIPILSAPKTCQSSDYGQDSRTELQTSAYGAPVGVIEKGATYKEISRALDCNTEVWKMVQSGDSVGWVKEEQLNKVSTTKLVQSVRCEADPSATECQKNVEKNAKDNLLKNENKDGLVYLKPVVNGNKETKADFSNEDMRCKSSEELAAESERIKRKIARRQAQGNYMSANNSNQPTMGGTPVPELSKDQLIAKSVEIETAASNELAKMSKSLGISPDDLEDGINPYNRIAATIKRVKALAHSCLKIKTQERAECSYISYMSSNLPNWSGKVVYKKTPTMSDLSVEYKRFAQRGNFAPDEASLSYYTPPESELASLSVNDVKQGLKSCEERYVKMEKDSEDQRAAALDKAAAQWDAQAKAYAKEHGGKVPVNPYSMGQGQGGYIGSGMYGYGYGSSGTSGSNCPNCTTKSKNQYSGSAMKSNSVYSSMAMMGMVGMGGSDIHEKFETLSKASDEQIKKYKKSIVTFSKMCNARFNLMNNSTKKDSISCSQAPKVISASTGEFPKDMVKSLYKDNPELLLSEVNQFGDQQLYDAMMDLKPPKKAMSLSVAQAQMDEAFGEPVGSYCPNKTADYIEDLMKNNPCITHVYVPTNFLSKKLDNSGKVIFRKFDKTDRFAVEFGDPICK